MFMSPPEKAVLSACEQDRTIAEVQVQLLAEFEPEQTLHAFRWLRRMRMLEVQGDANSLDPNLLYRQSAIGALFLLRQRLRETEGVLAHA